LITRETKDLEEIKLVLCNPVIYDAISDDDSPSLEDYETPINDDYLYIGAYVDNKIIGLMVYHKFLNGNKCHIQVLPDFREKYAKDIGEQVLTFRGHSPLYAEIPDLYPNVLRFALHNKFKVVGIRKNDYKKHGKTYDIKVLEYKNDGIC
jgi:hypothetical protein